MHPIIVHFPIALLVLYTLIECISFFHRGFSHRFATTKIVMLVIGTLGALVSIQTGEIAQEALGRSELIHQHEEFAELTYKIYLIICCIYLIGWEMIMLHIKPGSTGRRLYLRLYRLVTYVKHRGILVLLSLAGLVCLTIVGALGGAISHGPDTDPIARMIYDLVIGDNLKQ